LDRAATGPGDVGEEEGFAGQQEGEAVVVGGGLAGAVARLGKWRHDFDGTHDGMVHGFVPLSILSSLTGWKPVIREDTG
jgi:hypothetical protein